MADLTGMMQAAAGAGEPTDPNFNDTVLLLHGDGTNGAQNNTFLDSSTNNFTITRNGNVTQGSFSPFSRSSGNLVNAPYDPAVHGGSGYFDGSGDYLTCSGTAVGTGDVTIELWFYPTSSTVQYRTLFNSRSTSNTNTGFAIFQYGLTIEVYGNGLKGSSAAAAFGVDEWVHLALVRTSGTCQIYINGVASGSSFTYSNDLTSTLRAIGRNTPGGTSEYIGYISNVREVFSALYTTTFTPPTAPLTAVSGTELLLNFTNAGIFDNTGKNNLETVGDAQIDTSVKKYGTGSIEFDGTGDYLFLSATSDLVMGTGDFTIEMWVYYAGASYSGTQFLIDQRNTTSQIAIAFLFNDENLELYVDGLERISNAVHAAVQTWQHIALVRSSGTTTIYVDGTASGSTYSDTNNYVAPQTYIGSRHALASDTQLNGYIDDLRITKGVARYTANFTPPTAALPDL
jgi:hypothetical protein